MLELYKITQGNVNRATITSSPNDVVYEGVTYKSTPVKRTKIISRPDLLQNKVTLQLSVHQMLGLGLLAEVNSNSAHRLIIYRGEDVDSLEQIWAGALTDQMCDGEVATITYGGGGISLRQLGDRRPFQRRCPFVLYDSLTCQATPQVSSARVTAINPTKDVLEVSGIATHSVGYFTGGVICPNAVYSADNAGNRFISSHNKTASGDQLRLSTPLQASIGDNISVLAGCDRTWQTCYSKFDNIINFGGFPFLPLENPYIAEVCSDDGVRAPAMPAGNGNGGDNGNGNGGASTAEDLFCSGSDSDVAVSLSGKYRISIMMDTGSDAAASSISLGGSNVTYGNMMVNFISGFWRRIRSAIPNPSADNFALLTVGYWNWVTYHHSSLSIARGEPAYDDTDHTALATRLRDTSVIRYAEELTDDNRGRQVYTRRGTQQKVFLSYVDATPYFGVLNPIGWIYGVNVPGVTAQFRPARGSTSGLSTNNSVLGNYRVSQMYTWNAAKPFELPQTGYDLTHRDTVRIPVQNVSYVNSSEVTDILIILGSTPIATDVSPPENEVALLKQVDALDRTYPQQDIRRPGDVENYRLATMVDIVHNRAPFASPHSVKIYGFGFGDKANVADKLVSVVNSGATHIKSSYEEACPDPGLLFHSIFDSEGNLK